MSLVEKSKPFLDYLDGWRAELPVLPLGDLLIKPDHTAVMVVDMIEGFCSMGPLSSPRVNALRGGIADLLEKVYDAGVRDFVLAQDSHEPDAVEFGAFPPHCVRGTAEAETIAEIRALPFFGQMTLVEKNALASYIGTSLNAWLDERPRLETFIILGNCTDLCVYQFAMHLRLQANQLQRQRRVIVPADLVATYDRPVAAALAQGGLAHDGDLIDSVFLYHMALNAVEVVAAIR